VILPRYLVHGRRSSPFYEIVKIGTLSQWGYIPTGAAADPKIGQPAGLPGKAISPGRSTTSAARGASASISWWVT